MPAINLLRSVSSPGLAQDSVALPTDLIVAVSLCLILTTSAVCARLFTKVADLRRLQVDDYAIIFSVAGLATFAGLVFVGAKAGLGAHAWTLSPAAIKRSLVYSNALDIVYAPTMFAAKFAILVQIDRLFSGNSKRLTYWGVRAMVIINAVCYAGMFFIHIFACTPRARIFDGSVSGKCISQDTTILATGSFNVASDVFILLFSVWGVSKLRLTSKRQMLVVGVFTIGSFACVASACRLVYGVKVPGNKDITAAIFPLHLWSLAELTPIMYIACCPTFPRLMQYIQGIPASRSPTHSKWTSDNKSASQKRRTLDKRWTLERRWTLNKPQEAPTSESRKSLIQNSAPMPINNLPLPEQEKALPVAPISKYSTKRDPATIYSQLPRPESHFAPSERPISHISYESRTTAALDDILRSYDPNGVPTSPMSFFTTPASPAQTEFSVAHVEDAVPMQIMPVYFATIKKTTDVRISTHTNQGSPIAFGSPEW